MWLKVVGEDNNTVNGNKIKPCATKIDTVTRLYHPCIANEIYLSYMLSSYNPQDYDTTIKQVPIIFPDNKMERVKELSKYKKVT